MKRIFNWQVVLGLILIILTAAFYLIHYVIFRDAHHIFIYLIGDIAFVFFEVLLVTLIIHKVLTYREKKSMLNKLNMVIGTFFSELGKDLLCEFITLDSNNKFLIQEILVDQNLSKKEIIKYKVYFKNYISDIKAEHKKLDKLKEFLSSKRGFCLNLLANPNLLEHESFTNLLWSIFHLIEELEARKSFKKIKDKDCEHLRGDIKRVYSFLIFEWLEYMLHLKKNYPYLFSLALRTNPFNKDAKVELE